MKARKGISEFIMTFVLLVVAVSVIFAVLAAIFIRPSEFPSHFGAVNESTDDNSTNNHNSTFGAVRDTNYWNATNISAMSFGWIISNVSRPEYEPTLNMSELLYKGNEVIWVYQIDIPKPEYKGIIRTVPCVKIKNGSRYCTVK